MSRIAEAVKRAAAEQPVGDIATLNRLTVATKPLATLEDYTAEPPPSFGNEAPSTTSDGRHSLGPTARTESDALAHATQAFAGRLVSDPSTDRMSVEQYRRLGATLHQMQLQHGLKLLMVTSARPRDGKTLTATNLALTLSEALHRRVLLIDGDLRRPFVHEVFAISNATGLADALRLRGGVAPLVEVTARLTVLPSGQPDAHSLAGLASDRMGVVLKEAAARFDWVILDTPPVGLISDANLMADLVDGVVLVIGAGRGSYRLVERAVAELGREKIVGTVLNGMEHVDELPTEYWDPYDHVSRPS